MWMCNAGVCVCACLVPLWVSLCDAMQRASKKNQDLTGTTRRPVHYRMHYSPGFHDKNWRSMRFCRVREAGAAEGLGSIWGQGKRERMMKDAG